MECFQIARVNLRKLPRLSFLTCYILCFGELFFLCYVANQFFNADALTALTLGLGVFAFAAYDPFFFVKYFRVLVLDVLGKLAGVYVVENSTLWLSELLKFSGRHGSLWLFCLIEWEYIVAIYFFESVFGQVKPPKLETLQRKWCLNGKNVTRQMLLSLGFLTLGLNLILFCKTSTHPYFIYGYDRFRYEKVILAGKWRALYSLLSYLIPVMALLYIYGFKKLMSCIIVVYFANLLFCGVKFGDYFYTVYMLLPAFLGRKINLDRRKLSRSIFTMFGVFGVCIAVAVVHTSLLYSASPFQYLEQRVAQQGQLWWEIYGQENGKQMRLDELEDEYSQFFSDDTQEELNYNFGIYKMMRRATPMERVRAKLASGSRYSGSTMSSIYYYFKEPGLVLLTPLMALLMVLSLNWYWRCLFSGEILNSIIARRFTNVISQVNNMSDWQVLFSYKVFGLLLVSILLNFLFSFTTVQKRNSYGES